VEYVKFEYLAGKSEDEPRMWEQASLSHCGNSNYFPYAIHRAQRFSMGPGMGRIERAFCSLGDMPMSADTLTRGSASI
jgi:hypothetical protein